MTTHKIYCAGPLFNKKEKEEMLEIAIALEKNDFEVFLPQRDGIELVNLSEAFRKIKTKQKPEPSQIDLIISKAIFALDVFQVLDSDGLILNLNGRVPDEGAMVEAGMAWTANKKIVLFKNDSRSILNGGDNPLVSGLSNFVCVSTPDAVVSRFKELFDTERKPGPKPNPNLNDILLKGETIYKYIDQKHNSKFFAELLLDIFENDGETLRVGKKEMYTPLGKFIQE